MPEVMSSVEPYVRMQLLKQQGLSVLSMLFIDQTYELLNTSVQCIQSN